MSTEFVPVQLELFDIFLYSSVPVPTPGAREISFNKGRSRGINLGFLAQT